MCFPKASKTAIDIQVAAAQRLGLRVLLTRGSMNRSQRDGGLPPDSVVQDEDTILADSERLVARYHQARRRRDDPDRARALLAVFGDHLADARDRRTGAAARCAHAYASRETEDENRYCLELHKCRPLDYLEDCGWLNERTWLAHGVHFNADEFKRLARAGTPLRIAPAATRRWRRAPARSARWKRPASRRPRRRRLGLERRLELDAGGARRLSAAARPLRRRKGQSSRRAALGDQRLRGLRRARRCRRIAVGALADLALFKLDELRFSGSGDPLAALVLCGAHRADRVMVGGRWIVENGKSRVLTSPI